MAGKKSSEIDVVRMDRGRIRFAILGRTPIILNRMSTKAKHTLLMPAKRGKKSNDLKHDMVHEFRESAYLDHDNGPTYIQHLASAFKGALRNAALDLEGVSKAQIGRLTWVEGERVAIYGIPKLFASVTRSADINKTPDVRTRCIVPKWAAFIDISFVKPNLKEPAIINLLAAAGMIAGIGDWRPEKGSGTYGQFEPVSEDDKEFQRIINEGGRAAQEAAMLRADPYDDDTRDLIEWFAPEALARGFTTTEAAA